MKKVDTRGTSCPQPVLMTKIAVASSTNEVEVMVDNNASMNNVVRFLKHSGFSKIDIKDAGDDTLVLAKR